MEEGRIIKALSGFYYVQTENGVVECRARGRFRKEGTSPLVGDCVSIVREQGKGTVDTILPRRNAFIRPAVANMDVLVVLASCAIPQTEPFLIDRILTIAARQDVPCLVCVNKDDLAPAAPLADIYRKAGIPTIVTSAATGEGIEALRAQIAGKFAVFTGNSGVGKSSVLNALAPELALPVGEVSQKLGRGRHTTRHIELFSLPGGTYIADTPGFSSFDTDRMDAIPEEELAQTALVVRPEKDETFLRKNARLTAEGALATVMRVKKRALMRETALVTGYGRIGREMTARLCALGMFVIVCARSEEQMRMAHAAGAHPVPLAQIAAACRQADVIINTIPAHVLGDAALAETARDTPIIELASAPYGLEMQKAVKLGLQVCVESGLPGRYAPLDAGEALFDALTRAMGTRKEDAQCAT